MNQLNREIAAIRNQISMYDTILNFEDLSKDYRKEVEGRKDELKRELRIRLDEMNRK